MQNQNKPLLLEPTDITIVLLLSPVAITEEAGLLKKHTVPLVPILYLVGIQKSHACQ